MKRAMVVAAVVGMALGLWAPSASAEVSYSHMRATVVGKVHEPERFVRDGDMYSLWDDEDWVALVRQCKSTYGSGGTRCNWRTTRVYMTRAQWDRRSVGDSCINVQRSPCHFQWGSTNEDPAIRRGPRA